MKTKIPWFLFLLLWYVFLCIASYQMVALVQEPLRYIFIYPIGSINGFVVYFFHREYYKKVFNVNEE